MINYEKYKTFRDAKGLKDADIAKIAGISPSTLTDWKQGKSIPKYEKMARIALALGMDYYEFVGPVGKFSSLNPNKPELPMLNELRPKTEREKFNDELLRLYHNATPDAQSAVMTLLKNSQKESLKSSREA